MDSHLPSTSKRHQLERYGRDGAGSHNEALIKDIENTGTRPDVLLTLGRIPVLQVFVLARFWQLRADVPLDL